MTLLDIINWLKTKIECDQYYMNTIRNAEQCIAIYDNRLSPSPRIAIGGLDNTSYTTKVITLLIRWGKNNSPAELKAKEVYDLFYGQTATIGGKRVISFDMRTTHPISMGADSEGNFEYVIDVNIKYER